MNILLFTDHTFIPHRAGGRESSIKDLGSTMTRMGHFVTVLAKSPSLTQRVEHGLEFSFALEEAQDPFKYLMRLTLRNKYDLIVASVDGPNYELFYERFPAGACLFVRDDQNVEVLTKKFSDKFLLVTNSVFLSKKLAFFAETEIPVFPPLIDLSLYRTKNDRESGYVTFVNPVPKKGLSIGLEIARLLPQVNFLFCEGWPQTVDQWSSLENNATELKNIRLMRRQTDMRNIYKLTKVLLVPSQWEEAWGRVVTEAQVNGIPCFVSGIGGLPESCGEGGVVLSKDATPEEWASKLENILKDKKLYEKFSNLAFENSKKYSKMVSSYVSKMIALSDKFKSNIKKNLNNKYEFTELQHFSSFSSQSEFLSYFQYGNLTAVSEDLNEEVYVLNSLLDAKDGESIKSYFLENRSKIVLNKDLAFKLALAFQGIKDYAQALRIWNYLFVSYLPESTPFWHQSTGICLEGVGKADEALVKWEWLIDNCPSGNRIVWFRRLLDCAFSLANEKVLNERSLQFLDEFPADKYAQRFVSISSLFKGDHIRCLEMTESSCDRSLYDLTDQDYSFLTSILFYCGSYKRLEEVLDLASEQHSKSFKGLSLTATNKEVDRFDLNGWLSANRFVETTATWSRNLSCDKVLVCSWPGLLPGNRYMDNYEKIVRENNAIFVPINMPSSGVYPAADIFIIQFPDVIKWRNKNASLLCIEYIMEREVAALRVWKKAGVKIVWIVHNLLPHDIAPAEKVIWSRFFLSLADISDEVHLMAKSTVEMIEKSIPNIKNIPCKVFDHPPYTITSYSESEVKLARKKIGFAESDVVIGIFGSVAAYKGIADFLNAFLQVDVENAYVLCVGRARDEDSRNYIYKVQSKDSRIIFLEEYLENDLYDMLALTCNKFVVPNKEYLNSGAIIYALSCGKPTLALEHPFSVDVRSSLVDPSMLSIVSSFDDVESIKRFVLSSNCNDKWRYSDSGGSSIPKALGLLNS